MQIITYIGLGLIFLFILIAAGMIGADVYSDISGKNIKRWVYDLTGFLVMALFVLLFLYAIVLLFVSI